MTLRIGPAVERHGAATLADAVALVEAWARAVPRRDPVRLRHREFAPVQQVAARAQIRGPRGLRGGIDVRGDGSAEAYHGWIRKELVERRDDESPVDALRRELGAA